LCPGVTRGLEGAETATLTTVSGAAKSNVLMFLSAMCAMGAVWLGIVAVTGPDLLYAVMALLLVVATVVAFRAYRKVLRELDEQERRT